MLGKDENLNFILNVARACLLTVNAGFLNSASVSGVYSVPVSHVTGISTALGISLSSGNFSSSLFQIGIVVSFLVGSALAKIICTVTELTGVRLRKPGLRGIINSGYPVLKRNSSDQAVVISESTDSEQQNLPVSKGSYNDCYWSFANILLLQSGMVIVSYFLGKSTDSNNYFCEYTLAFSCGLQNALTGLFSNGLLRSTHVTGTTTDIGVIVGQLLCSLVMKRRPINQDGAANLDTWKLPVLVALLVGFVVGTTAGSAAYSAMGLACLIISASLTFALALLHLILGSINSLSLPRRYKAATTNEERKATLPDDFILGRIDSIQLERLEVVEGPKNRIFST